MISFERVPPPNLEIYARLFEIEIALRELIIEEFELKFGSRWWKSRLPVDIKQTFIDSVSYERNIGWMQLISHHPMYYTHFPQIKTIIIKKDNWREVFREIFRSEG